MTENESLVVESLCSCNGTTSSYCIQHGLWRHDPQPAPSLTSIDALLNTPPGKYPEKDEIYVYLDEDTALRLEGCLYAGQRDATTHHVNNKALKMERGEWQDDGPEECLTLMRCRTQAKGCRFPVAPWTIVLTNGQGRVKGTITNYENVPNYRSYVARMVLKTVETDQDIYAHYFFDTDTGTGRGAGTVRAAQVKTMNISQAERDFVKKVIGAAAIVQMRDFEKTAAHWRVGTHTPGVYDPHGRFPLMHDLEVLNRTYEHCALKFAQVYATGVAKDDKDSRSILKGFFCGNGVFAPGMATLLPDYTAQGVRIDDPKVPKEAVPGSTRKNDWLFCSDPARAPEFWDAFFSGKLDPRDIRHKIRQAVIFTAANKGKTTKWFYETGGSGDVASPSRAAICMFAWQLYCLGLHLDETIKIPPQYKSVWPTTRAKW